MKYIFRVTGFSYLHLRSSDSICIVKKKKVVNLNEGLCDRLSELQTNSVCWVESHQ